MILTLLFVIVREIVPSAISLIEVGPHASQVSHFVHNEVSAAPNIAFLLV